MNSETVDLIATDPPFNKGRDFHATPDSLAAGAKFQDRWSWERDVHQAWVDQITDDFPKLMEAIESARYAHSDGMGAYMCFMAVRLLEMRRVLRLTGSIYLHCDPTASHYLKAVMDAIFGWRNFRNEIVWCYTGPSNTKRWFPRKNDTIFSYSKSDKWTFNWKEIRAHYVKLETGKTSGIFKQEASLDLEGKVPEDWWTQFSPVGRLVKERIGYPTQKPLALYERIIRASSNSSDVILDPFAGCATTLVVAEKLQRRWVGMDIWEGAHALVERRLSDTTGLFGNVTFTAEQPARTDEGPETVAYLQVPERIKEPEANKMSRAEMYDFLLAQHGPRCQGCDRIFDDPRYLQLDHNTPRSDGGLNHITNRVLLCGPCNQAKSNIYTLSGLRRLNKKNGWMAK